MLPKNCREGSIFKKRGNRNLGSESLTRDSQCFASSVVFWVMEKPNASSALKRDLLIRERICHMVMVESKFV